MVAGVFGLSVRDRLVAGTVLGVGLWQFFVHRVWNLVAYDLTFVDIWRFMFADLSPHLVGAQLASAAELVAIFVGLAGLFLRSSILPLTGVFACGWFLAWTVSERILTTFDHRSLDPTEAGVLFLEAALLAAVLGVGWAWAFTQPQSKTGMALASLPIVIAPAIILLS